MKYSELTGWKRIIAEACRTNKELIPVIDKMLEEAKKEAAAR